MPELSEPSKYFGASPLPINALSAAVYEISRRVVSFSQPNLEKN